MHTIQELCDNGWSPERAPKFHAWMKEMDKLCMQELGIGVHDFPDWDFAGHFEDGHTAKEAFKIWMSDTLPNEFHDLI